jgi:hypothetical protein
LAALGGVIVVIVQFIAKLSVIKDSSKTALVIGIAAGVLGLCGLGLVAYGIYRRRSVRHSFRDRGRSSTWFILGGAALLFATSLTLVQV